MNQLDVTFFKGLALFVSERLAELRIRLVLQGIQVVRKEYSSLMAGMPEVSFFAVGSLGDMTCAVHAGSKLVGVATDRMLGGNGVVVDRDQPPLTFSEQFLFKTLVGWIELYFQQRELDFVCHRIAHHSRNLHLFFNDEQVACVTIKMKLNQGVATTLQFLCPSVGIVDTKSSPGELV